MDGKIKIVIADDQELIRESLKIVLSANPDMEVTDTVADGREVIRSVRACRPDVILMDEPTSALDPISTSKIEDLAMELKEKYTIIIVTHNMQQAARISDQTAFFLLGECVEFGDTGEMFAMPKDKRTEDYITGRFG